MLQKLPASLHFKFLFEQKKERNRLFYFREKLGQESN